MKGDSVKKGKRPIKEEMSSLFNTKKSKVAIKKAEWKHKFYCLAKKDQKRIPTKESEKGELYECCLGEKDVEFHSLTMNRDEFRETLIGAFPALQDAGGYQLLKCVPNSRTLEVLPSSCYVCPSNLKQRVGSARTYICPIQRDLSVEPQLNDDKVH